MTGRFAVLAGVVLAALTVGCTSTRDSVGPTSASHALTHATTHATTHARSSSAGSTSSRTAAGGAAAAVLTALPVKGRAPTTGYTRERFGQAWTDDNDDPGGHNGCDTRNDVLRRDLVDDVLKADTNGCVLLTGTLHDPYTGRTIAFRRGISSSADIQIDHVVALSDAWQTGAQQLSDRERVDLANDPLELLAVDGPTNEQKGDGDAATWLPPNKAYRCDYVARQLAVKQAYHLWLTPAEAAAIGRVLGSCPGQSIPHEATVPQPRASPRTSAGTPSSSPDSSCTTTSTGSCIRGGEACPQDSYGRTGHDAEGRAYVCKGDTDRPHWETP